MMHAHTHFDRTIFLRKLSASATSLYINICHLLDEDLTPNLIQIRRMWNGNDHELYTAVEELVNEGILVWLDFWREDNRWWLYPSTQWFPKRPGQGFIGSRKKYGGN